MMLATDQKEIEWRVRLWPRQRQALETEATELLFGGASRGGKSHLAREALTDWCLLIPGLQCKIFRRFSEDVISNHMDSETGFKNRLARLVARGLVEIVQTQVRFVFNGSLISLHHCQEQDLEKYQGRGTHVLVLDEATQLSEKIIRFLRGWVTMTEEMKARLPEWAKGKFPRIIYTANPIGMSVAYFRRHFVKSRPAFEIEQVGAFKQQYIPSRVEDNPSEDAAAARARLTDIGGEAMASALIEGNWDAPVGEFFPEWRDDRHVVADFLPPPWWSRFRTFDWGTAEPFAVYWFAVSDGEAFTDFKGNVRWFPRDALIAYKEWYGCHEKEPAIGTRMRNEDIAYGILQRSQLPEEANMLTISDSLPFQDRGGKTIAQTFYDCGVPLIHGDTSRVPGWAAMRGRLIGEEIDSNDGYKTPMLYFVRSCKYAAEYIPALPRHENPDKKAEDAAEHGEATHCCDAIRLACLARTRPKAGPPAEPDIRQATSTPNFKQALKIIQKNKKRKAHASAY